MAGRRGQDVSALLMAIGTVAVIMSRRLTWSSGSHDRIPQEGKRGPKSHAEHRSGADQERHLVYLPLTSELIGGENSAAFRRAPPSIGRRCTDVAHTRVDLGIVL